MQLKIDVNLLKIGVIGEGARYRINNLISVGLYS